MGENIIIWTIGTVHKGCQLSRRKRFVQMTMGWKGVWHPISKDIFDNCGVSARTRGLGEGSEILRFCADVFYGQPRNFKPSVFYLNLQVIQLWKL